MSGGGLRGWGAGIVATSSVKWFDPTNGYGFDQPEDGGPEVLVHGSAAECGFELLE
jgi:cold shock CspA family protein